MSKVEKKKTKQLVSDLVQEVINQQLRLEKLEDAFGRLLLILAKVEKKAPGTPP